MKRILLAPLGALLLLSCGEAVTEPPPVSGESPRAAAEAWMKEASVPLVTVEAGHGFEDLAPLKSTLAQARLVGLGEGSHGTREFFQLKHRMFEFLVTELGFTVLGVEANFTESLAVDHYVLTGEGDPVRAVKGLHFWMWDTEEVLALVEWMRAYNADPSHTRKVRFLGFDSQLSMGPTLALLDYLAEVDPAYRSEVEPWLSRLLVSSELNGGDPVESMVRAAGHIPRVRQLRERLEAQRAAYVRERGEEAFVLAARHAHMLEHAVVQSSMPDSARATQRDVFAAENVSWLLEREGPEAKMVLWAHNVHLMKENGTSWTPMGANLRDAFGDAFYMYRLTFNQGGFRAVLYPPGGPAQGVQNHQIDRVPSEGFEARLTRTGLPLLALDLRGAPTEGAVARYLAQRVPVREIQAVYSPGQPTLVNLRPRAAFDGVLFVETATASRPLPPLAP